MLLKRYMQAASNLFAENRLLKFCVVVLTVGFVLLAYRVDGIKDRVRTVVVPPVLHSKVEISGSWTTDSYCREYMRYLGALVWNYSPSTVREQFSESLASWHPDVFQMAKERFYLLADQVEKTRASSAFYIHKIHHEAEKNYVEVTGNRVLMMQDKSVDTATKTYFVAYKVENGRFWIMGIEEKTDRSSKPSAAITGEDADTTAVKVGKGDSADAKP